MFDVWRLATAFEAVFNVPRVRSRGRKNFSGSGFDLIQVVVPLSLAEGRDRRLCAGQGMPQQYAVVKLSETSRQSPWSALFVASSNAASIEEIEVSTARHRRRREGGREEEGIRSQGCWWA